MTDDKGYLRAYDLSWLITILDEHLKAKPAEELKKKDGQNTNQRHLANLPKIPPRDMPALWYTRAHYEIIKSLEYVQSEQILITTAFDKKVKLWDSTTGKVVDSFQ